MSCLDKGVGDLSLATCESNIPVEVDEEVYNKLEERARLEGISVDLLATRLLRAVSPKSAS
jgi:hypothetical protein